MEIPLTDKDVQFLISIVTRYIYQRERAYQRPRQQEKAHAIHARDGYDAHLNSINRAQNIRKQLEHVIHSPDELV